MNKINVSTTFARTLQATYFPTAELIIFGPKTTRTASFALKETTDQIDSQN
jgi:hypothetical protein